MKIQDILFTAASVAVIIFGLIALVLAGNGTIPSMWIAALITLLGVIAVANNQVIGISMAGVGAYLMLRDFGLIQVAWLGYGIGVFLITAGVYGMFQHRRLRREKIEKSRTPAR